ncbi:hypothetical protein [Methanobacterium ferruginis]|uniref:hypothetical protein n=1 Tax=Methanobacterium ferruginis TaxID=710191 RepID=UPI00257424C6|nr:hypothetical protein [Methanobacterium ferruginis]BDZ68064.1 hypothetical protein GCM10025860_15120 [Methanobacterium ferruginis]
MSYFKVDEVQKDDILLYNVKGFLFKLIKEEFGYGYVPEYHQDIKDLENFYLNPVRNNFF